MTDRVHVSDVTPQLPLPETPRAQVCVLASLNFPGISAEDVGLIRRFTRLALTTLLDSGPAMSCGTPPNRSTILRVQGSSTVCCCSVAATSTAAATA